MTLITNQNQFLEVCQKINNSEFVAIDTEFMREKTYYPLLCLLQINVNGELFVIDTLSKNIDLEPFFLILENHKICKIFHSARQDLEVLTIVRKFTPKSVIDTQIMANFFGLDYNISYAGLVQEVCNQEVNKDLQRSNWQLRPLSQEQIEYAASDVLHLLVIYQFLKNKLQKEQKLAWFLEEMEGIISNQNYDIDSNYDLFKKFSFAKKNNSYKENVKNLAIWRNSLAKKENLPRSFIIKDDLLSQIAYSAPKNLADLESLDRKIKFLNEHRKKEIIDILLNPPKNLEPESNIKERLDFRLNEQQELTYQEARNLLQAKAEENNLKAEFISTINGLKKVILGHEKVEEFITGWRYEVFGRDLAELVSKSRN